LRRRRSACHCGHESENENRDLFHLPATPGSLRSLINPFGRQREIILFNRTELLPTIWPNFSCSPCHGRSRPRFPVDHRVSTISLIAELADRVKLK
jgi:hypothetical protein